MTKHSGYNCPKCNEHFGWKKLTFVKQGKDISCGSCDSSFKVHLPIWWYWTMPLGLVIFYYLTYYVLRLDFPWATRIIIIVLSVIAWIGGVYLLGQKQMSYDEDQSR